MVTYGQMPASVVVSGIGVVSTLGASRESFRDGLLAGRSGIAPVTAFDVSDCRTRVAASVTGFEPTAWIPPMKLRRMDDTARYAVVVTRQAFDDAAYPLGADGDDRVGVILGTFTAGGQPTSEYLRALHAGGPAGAPAILFNSTVANAPASLAGLEFKLRGPNVTVSQKESFGLAAIVTATDAFGSVARRRSSRAASTPSSTSSFACTAASASWPTATRPGRSTATAGIRPRRGRLCAPARRRDGVGIAGGETVRRGGGGRRRKCGRRHQPVA